ncbi:glycoside hydrolase family 43 protein [Thermophagus sp. OGC60D27]|uniref:glycoside hydrolase family 43 protein n=1 Tax=Thermophagus sp. OGC60D27 TaxID=3458415 RepID=UPI0040382BF4
MKMILRKYNSFLLLFIAFCVTPVVAQIPPEKFENPVISGFHPDPSICRVGDDYYLVNSSFEWFPGLPIYHSKDLVNWELISYGLTRPDQVELPEGLPDSRGIYAPAIKYHDGRFYIITTCVGCNRNFYITATDPKGPWSDPVWLSSPGIDPSLFWDDDGTCYYVGHANISGKNEWPNKNGVWIQQIDLESGKLLGERKQLTHGHAKNARWTEGPHIYKIDNTYVLFVAEGGTGFHHSVTAHHSDNVLGPYIPYHSNPILTHRHLGTDYPIHSVGHTDIVQTQNGDWWAVMLGKRKYQGFTLLGRETFLTPIKFEKQEGIPTPVFNPGIGRLLDEQTRPDLPWTPVAGNYSLDDFNSDELALYWNFLRTPNEKWYSLDNGKLDVELRPEVLDSLVNPSFIGRRITDHQFIATTKVNFDARNKNEEAGIAIYRTSKSYVCIVKTRNELILKRVDAQGSHEVARVDWKEDEVILQAETNGLDLIFKYGNSIQNLKRIGDSQPLEMISDEKVGGFNGPYIGMYATSNGLVSRNEASFDWFEYLGK